MIRAGTIAEISPTSGEWVILDIGFACKTASCGLLIDQGAPIALPFGQAVDKLCAFIARRISPVNLLIEAPLSATFNKAGNPTGRAIEKRGSKTRYWYVGLGCTVMVAALYLIKAITEAAPDADVRLFEGFVSFKAAGSKSDHFRDVQLLREVVDNPHAYSHAIAGADQLKMAPTDILQSTFLIAGIDAGIPPVIVRDNEV